MTAAEERQVRAVLRGTRALVAEGHAKHALAVNRRGRKVPIGSKGAVGWCLGGGLLRACAQQRVASIGPVFDFVEGELRAAGAIGAMGTVMGFNDRPSTTQQGVLDLLDEWIGKLGGEEGGAPGGSRAGTGGQSA